MGGSHRRRVCALSEGTAAILVQRMDPGIVDAARPGSRVYKGQTHPLPLRRDRCLSASRKRGPEGSTKGGHPPLAANRWIEYHEGVPVLRAPLPCIGAHLPSPQ